MTNLVYMFGGGECPDTPEVRSIVRDAVKRHFRCGGAFTATELSRMTADELNLVALVRAEVVKEDWETLVRELVGQLMKTP